MAEPDIHKISKEVQTLLRSADGKLTRIEGDLAKASAALAKANAEGSVPKMELWSDVVKSYKPALDDGAHDAQQARDDIERLRKDAHFFKAHLKQLVKLVEALDAVEQRYAEKIKSCDDLLQDVGVWLIKLRRSNKELVLAQASLSDEIDDLLKELTPLERSAAKLADAARQAAAQRDPKGIDLAVKQFKRLELEKVRQRVNKMQLRLNDLQALDPDQRAPGAGDRDALTRKLRDIEPRLEKLAELERSAGEQQVERVDVRSAARALGLTDPKEVKQLESLLDGPDLARQLDPLARRHDANGKEWVKLLEKSKVL